MNRLLLAHLNFRALAASVGCAAALCATASAQTVSDELQIVSGTNTFTYTANDPAAGAGFEPVLAFANYSGGTQSSDDYSSAMTSAFVTGSGTSATFNSANAVTWLTGVSSSLKMFVLTEPSPNTTTYSDVIFTFNFTSGSSSLNAIALISDPTLVADIMSAVNTYNAIPLVKKITPAMTPETGALQNVTTFLYGTTAPFTVNILSAVPEPESALLLAAAGLMFVPIALRRRRRS